MNIITVGEASRISYAPSKQYLGRLARRPEHPKFFVFDGVSWKIDIDHPEWLALLERREAKANADPVPVKKPVRKKRAIRAVPSTSLAAQDVRDTAKIKNLLEREKLRERKIKNEIAYLQLQRDSGNVVEYALAEFLFFGHLEKLHSDLLRMGKKIEPIIDNLVKEKRTREIVKRYRNEIEMVIREIKNSSMNDVKKWSEERGA